MGAKPLHDAECLAKVAELLRPLGYTLDAEQPHIGGERSLMSAGRYVLLGRDAADQRVVIKVGVDTQGIAEVTQSKRASDLLRTASFSNDSVLLPPERWYGVLDGLAFQITAFIEQDAIFVTRPLETQFFLALRALESHEAFHITTREHRREAAGVLPVRSTGYYLQNFEGYQAVVAAQFPHPELLSLLDRAKHELTDGKTAIERYLGYLIHSDFVPHNMRVRGRDLYVLDHAAFWFGNKYEGWARLINYLVLHNPPLAELLVEHVKRCRPRELPVLRLMRLYKLGTLLAYYASILPKTAGDLRALTEARIAFWGTVLKAVLDDTPVDPQAIDAYRRTRDTLRSEQEKQRQREFAVA